MGLGKSQELTSRVNWPLSGEVRKQPEVGKVTFQKLMEECQMAQKPVKVNCRDEILQKKQAWIYEGEEELG